MYNVTPYALDLYNKNYRQIVRITFKGKDGVTFVINEDRILQGGLSIDRYSASGSKIELASAVAAELTLKLKNDDGKYDKVLFEGAELFVEIGIQRWDADRWEHVETEYTPCGYFIIDTPPRTRSTINISALDRMMLFDRLADMEKFTFPMTLETLMEQVCRECGVEHATDFGSLVNHDYVIVEAPDEDDLTYRKIIQWCAFLTATCAYMDYDGKLVFKWYEQVDYTVSPSERYSSDMYENDIVITGLVYKASGKEDVLLGTTTYTLVFDNCGLLQENADKALENVFNAINGFTYRPYEATIKPAPFLYPMDMIHYVDKDGEEHNTVVTHTNFTANQNTSIAGSGSTTTSNDYVAGGGGMTAQQNQAVQALKTDVGINIGKINTTLGSYGGRLDTSEEAIRIQKETWNPDTREAVTAMIELSTKITAAVASQIFDEDGKLAKDYQAKIEVAANAIKEQVTTWDPKTKELVDASITVTDSIRSAVTKVSEKDGKEVTAGSLLEQNYDSIKGIVGDDQGNKGSLTLTKELLEGQISDTKQGLETKISETASGLETKVSNAETGFNTKIQQTENSFSVELNKKLDADSAKVMTYLLLDEESGIKLRTDKKITLDGDVIAGLISAEKLKSIMAAIDLLTTQDLTSTGHISSETARVRGNLKAGSITCSDIWIGTSTEQTEDPTGTSLKRYIENTITDLIAETGKTIKATIEGWVTTKVNSLLEGYKKTLTVQRSNGKSEYTVFANQDFTIYQNYAPAVHTHSWTATEGGITDKPTIPSLDGYAKCENFSTAGTAESSGIRDYINMAVNNGWSVYTGIKNKLVSDNVFATAGHTHTRYVSTDAHGKIPYSILKDTPTIPDVSDFVTKETYDSHQHYFSDSDSDSVSISISTPKHYHTIVGNSTDKTYNLENSTDSDTVHISIAGWTGAPNTKQ